MAGIFRAQTVLGVVLVVGALAGWLAPSGPTFVVVNFCVGLAAVAMLGVQGAFIRHSPAGQAVQINTTMVASVGVLEGVGRGAGRRGRGDASRCRRPTCSWASSSWAWPLAALRTVPAEGVPPPV